MPDAGDQLFGLMAGVALLLWLVGRGAAPDLRWRRRAELLAVSLVALGIFFAVLRSIILFPQAEANCSQPSGLTPNSQGCHQTNST